VTKRCPLYELIGDDIAPQKLANFSGRSRGQATKA
jgi:hypothetical protein